MIRFACSLLSAVLLFTALPARAGEDTHAVGREFAYRLFGEARKNREILVQNSRATPVEVYDEGRGAFVAVSGHSDVELGCRGMDRLLKARFRDSFREYVPFQVRMSCGREIQFVDPKQFASRVAPTPALVPPPEGATGVMPATGVDGAQTLTDTAAPAL